MRLREAGLVWGLWVLGEAAWNPGVVQENHRQTTAQQTHCSENMIHPGMAQWCSSL